MLSTEKAKSFIKGEFGKNLFISSVGIGIWSVASFFANILAGRLLGREEYGHYALALSVASIILIPLLWGLNTSMIKYGAGKSGRERDGIVSAALMGFIGLLIVGLIMLWIFRLPLMSLFNVSSRIYQWAIILSFAMTLQLMADAIFRTFHRFRTQAWWLIASSVLLVGMLVFLLQSPGKDFTSYVIPIVVSYAVLLLGAITILIRNVGSFHWNKPTFQTLTHFGFYAMMGSVTGTTLLNVDRLILNYYIDQQAVGLYFAYTVSSTMIMMKLMEVFVNVFFPFVSKSRSEEKALIFHRLRSRVFLFFPALLLLTGATTMVTLFFYGSEYRLDYVLLLLFSIQAPLLAIGSIFAWFINTLDMKTIRHFMFVGFVMIVLNVVGNFLMVPIWGLYGAVSATIITYIFYFIYVLLYLRNHFATPSYERLSSTTFTR